MIGVVVVTHGQLATELVNAAEVLWKLVRGGVLKARLDRTFPLAEAEQAHRRLEGRRSTGAMVLLP